MINALGVYSSRTETGLDWSEIFVQVAILLRCIGVYFSDNNSPFLSTLYTILSVCVTIPAEYQTLDSAHNFIVDCCMHPCGRSRNCYVLYITPQFAKFPVHVGFLLYKESRNRIIGLQFKLMQGHYPKNLSPSWMEAAYLLIRGCAPINAFAKALLK